MQLLTNATKLDWGQWLVGIMGAIISGGAGAVGAMAAVSNIDPATFNVTHPAKLLEAMLIVFLFSAIVSVAKWLQLHPTPQAESGNPSGPETPKN